ncbi:MAG TPA: class I SAM-dependent methyltransferase [Kofleriaceae bacterium]|nr:class I SAM-dependent methyltransferase [Kofleriaceae bacterium]
MQPSPLATPLAWNLVAPAYAAEVVPLFETYARRALELAAPPAAGRVVDVACGPGTLSLLAARAGHPVDALDFSPEMIAALERRLAGETGAPVGLHLADGQSLPFPDGRFAAGFSMFGLMFFPDRARGFAEMRRVLAPGARAVVSSWVPLDGIPAMAAMFAAVRAGLARLVPGGPPPEPPSFPLTSEEDCRREMGAAFAEVEVHRVSHTERYASAGELWQQLARTMAPLVLMRQTLGEEPWGSIAAGAEQAIAAALGPGPVSMTMTALLSVGVAA